MHNYAMKLSQSVSFGAYFYNPVLVFNSPCTTFRAVYLPLVPKRVKHFFNKQHSLCQFELIFFMFLQCINGPLNEQSRFIYFPQDGAN